METLYGDVCTVAAIGIVHCEHREGGIPGTSALQLYVCTRMEDWNLRKGNLMKKVPKRQFVISFAASMIVTWKI